MTREVSPTATMGRTLFFYAGIDGGSLGQRIETFMVNIYIYMCVSSNN